MLSSVFSPSNPLRRLFCGKQKFEKHLLEECSDREKYQRMVAEYEEKSKENQHGGKGKKRARTTGSNEGRASVRVRMDNPQ